MTAASTVVCLGGGWADSRVAGSAGKWDAAKDETTVAMRVDMKADETAGMMADPKADSKAGMKAGTKAETTVESKVGL